MRHKLTSFFLATSAFFSFAWVARAHEAYVLSPGTVKDAVDSVSPNPFDAFAANERAFLLIGGSLLLVFILSLLVSFLKRFTESLASFYMKLKKPALVVLRLGLGSSLIIAAVKMSVFGPELTMLGVFGALTPLFKAAMLVLGVLVILGFLTRIAGAVVIMIFALAYFTSGVYVLTYLTYPAMALALCIAGAGQYSLDHLLFPVRLDVGVREAFEEYGFIVLRILYAVAIAFAAYYAKFIHSNLALDTVNNFNLTNYFHFDPLFIVLGALITELSVAFLIFIGIQLRLVLVIFTALLVVTLFFFGEVLWPHITLFAINIALFLHGYDRLTLGQRFVDEGEQPVL